MGLDCSHGAFHGSYSAFNRLRQEVAYVTGGSFPPHMLRNRDGSFAKDKDGFFIRDKTLDDSLIYFGESLEEDLGLFEFLAHSDCDGEISPEMCAKVADELESILDKVSDDGTGHIAHQGGYRSVLQRFIDGCRSAAKSNEPLIFG